MTTVDGVGTFAAEDNITTLAAIKNIIAFFTEDQIVILATINGVSTFTTGNEIDTGTAVNNVIATGTVDHVITGFAADVIALLATGEDIIIGRAYNDFAGVVHGNGEINRTGRCRRAVFAGCCLNGKINGAEKILRRG